MRYFLISILSFVYVLMINSQTTQSITLDFNSSDFYYNSYDGYIESTTNDIIYEEDTNLPAIPFFPVRVKLPMGYTYSHVTYTSQRKVFANNVVLSNNPVYISTNHAENSFPTRMSNYTRGIYPESNIKFSGISDFGSYMVADFLVSPWFYDSTTGLLELMTTMTLNISLKRNTSPISVDRDSELSSYLNTLVVNPELNSKRNRSSRTSGPPICEYLIVTNEALSNYFKILRDWKTQKGVRAEIITVEQIDELYSGFSLQLKIKHYLRDSFISQGLKYVLLGGDDTIVPVQMCHGNVGSNIDNTIPTDLFYSCFSGSFNWDANGNSIYGEVEDSVDLTPSIFVTRAPVRTISDVTSFVTKILNYEQCPSINGWHNNILMGGKELMGMYDDTQSDAQAKGERLYNGTIAPYWQGKRVEFYDTYTDFPSGASFQFSADNLQNVLSNGYTFVQIATHGNQTLWTTETGDPYYRDWAANLRNNNPTIITTTACTTNAFDSFRYSADPCLSEAFIRNPNSNVVAYLGCSREGWGYDNTSPRLGPSFQYERNYYKLLFNSQILEKNWGKIVALAKAKTIPGCKKDGPNRWIQFGLNAIGDPEMPVFIDKPLEFTSVSIESLSSGLTLNTGIPGCRVCIMSCGDNGLTKYNVYDSIQSVSIDPITQSVSVCITKQGYIPRIFYLNSQDIFVQNEMLKNTSVYRGGRIFIGRNVTNLKEVGDVEVVNANIIVKGHEINICPGTIINGGCIFEAIGE